jgi:hypothetical protein
VTTSSTVLLTDAQAAISGAWPRKSLAPDRSMPSRRKSGSRLYGRRGRTSSSKSGGIRPTKELLGMRRPTSGRSLQPKNRTLTYVDKYGRRPMPLPRSLANIKREISEKKWTEARRWFEGRITTKYKIPVEQRPNRVVAGCSKRLAGRFYQLKTGHCLTGQYLQWTESRAAAKCGWCPCKVQTREHLFKNCPHWKPQQKTLWAEVWKETGRGKIRFKTPGFVRGQAVRPGDLGLPPYDGGGAEGGTEQRARGE